MRTLFFKNNVHNLDPIEIPGQSPRAINLTVRRGLKWSDLFTGQLVELREMGAPESDKAQIARIFDVKVMVFKDLINYSRMLDLGHDPKCRNWSGLAKVMRQVYDGFLSHEIVTLVFYEVEGVFGRNEDQL